MSRPRADHRRMAEHLAPRGVLFLEPWLTPAVYRENEVVHNFRRTRACDLLNVRDAAQGISRSVGNSLAGRHGRG
jgi:hypothetical protein